MHLNHLYHFILFLLVLVDIGYLFAKTLNITVKCSIQQISNFFTLYIIML